MLLIDNIKYLKENYPYVRERMKIIENQDKIFFIEDTKRGDKTLLYKNKGKNIYFHSKYNPIREAQALIEDYKNIENQNIIFYGTGLGYHIDLLMKENQKNDYYIFEPIPEILESFLSIRNLNDNQYKNLKGINVGLERIELELKTILASSSKKTAIITLPIHKQNYPCEFEKFHEAFLMSIKRKKRGIIANHSFQKRWLINSVANFKEILLTPNILMENNKQFKGKPALIVSAGPSLNEEIENIRYIKEKNLAYIFSVGSSINTLIENDIYPDAMCSFDPKVENQEVFKKVNDKGIVDIPMIFGSTIGFEVLEQYKGPKQHIIITQDTVSKYYLKIKNEKIKYVKDAPSVAVVTLAMLYDLGFSTIILVGQNLAYREGRSYSDGIDHRSTNVDIEKANNLVEIKDVYGKKVYTTDLFNSMRFSMEKYIDSFKNVEVINSTKGGAQIKGTTFMELDMIIKEKLKPIDILIDSKDEKKQIIYDKKYLKGKMIKTEKEYEKLKKLIDKLEDVIGKVKEAKLKRTYDNIEKTYSDLDVVFLKIINNDFSKIFINPMNRVNLNLLIESVNRLSDEKDADFKSTLVVETFDKIINLYKNSVNLLQDIFEKFKDMIQMFLDGKNIEDFNVLDIENEDKPMILDDKVKDLFDVAVKIINDPHMNILYDLKALFSKQYKQKIFNRMDVIIRYLAIEEHYGKNNYGYKIYEKMQMARGQKVHDIKRFEELIKSIEKNGFDMNSVILVDQNLKLMDGSHRLASALYFNIKNIPIKITPVDTDINYSMDWFEKSGFSNEELNIIKNKYDEIILEKKIFFVMTLWPPIQQYFEEITDEINEEYNVLKIEDYFFENEHEFNATVKGQYAIDDIEDWKIQKKLSYMNNYDEKIRMLILDIGDPNFRPKARNNKPISVEVENIKRRYREKYSKKIDNYFYDIIMHMGDNYEHSEHMVKIMKKDIDIIDFLQSIDSNKYSLVKVDVPYMPKNFPKTYPLNKDMDVVCSIDEFEEICKKAELFASLYINKYEIKKVVNSYNFRIRFELNGFLTYQIDISVTIEGLEDSFIKSALERRIYKNGFYTFDKCDEIIVRLNEYNLNPRKIHHYLYLIGNKEYLNITSLDSLDKNIKINEQVKYLIGSIADNDSGNRAPILGKRFRDNGKPVIILDDQQRKIKNQVMDKINANIYKFETTNCNVCKKNDFEVLSQKERNGLYMPVVICKNCGLIQCNPRMSQESLNEFYNSEFNLLFRNNNSPEEYFDIQYRRGESLYNYLNVETKIFKDNIEVLSVLEIGCGIGGILKYFKDKGCNIKGLDLGEEYIEYGKKNYELNLEVGTINNLEEDYKADIVIYRHVLEHVLDLNEELDSISKVLKPEGILYVEVPGVKNLDKTYDQDFIKYLMMTHIHHFTLTSLSNLLRLNNFEVISGDEIIRCIAQKNNVNTKQYINNDYYNTCSFLLKLENLINA